MYCSINLSCIIAILCNIALISSQYAKYEKAYSVYQYGQLKYTLEDYMSETTGIGIFKTNLNASYQHINVTLDAAKNAIIKIEILLDGSFTRTLRQESKALRRIKEKCEKQDIDPVKIGIIKLYDYVDSGSLKLTNTSGEGIRCFCLVHTYATPFFSHIESYMKKAKTDKESRKKIYKYFEGYIKNFQRLHQKVRFTHNDVTLDNLGVTEGFKPILLNFWIATEIGDDNKTDTNIYVDTSNLVVRSREKTTKRPRGDRHSLTYEAAIGEMRLPHHDMGSLLYAYHNATGPLPTDTPELNKLWENPSTFSDAKGRWRNLRFEVPDSAPSKMFKELKGHIPEIFNTIESLRPFVQPNNVNYADMIKACQNGK